MSDYSKLFDKELIFLNLDVSNRNELFKKVYEKLAEKGIVKESYLDALTKREDEFPTGVVTQFLPIALPHANPENVNLPLLQLFKQKMIFVFNKWEQMKTRIPKTSSFWGLLRKLRICRLSYYKDLCN
jgi:Phosphotransferase system mannitol/fructose-specific IIA domain (Ntr-type)